MSSELKALFIIMFSIQTVLPGIESNLSGRDQLSQVLVPAITHSDSLRSSLPFQGKKSLRACWCGHLPRLGTDIEKRVTPPHSYLSSSETINKTNGLPVVVLKLAHGQLLQSSLICLIADLWYAKAGVDRAYFVSNHLSIEWQSPKNPLRHLICVISILYTCSMKHHNDCLLI